MIAGPSGSSSRRVAPKGHLALFVALACVRWTHAASDELMVSAAASLEETVGEIVERYGELYPATVVTVNTAASGVLVSQIEHGAPVDLIFSASPLEIDRLEAKGLVRRREIVASGGLRVAVPPGRTAPGSFEAVADPRFERIAIGNPSTVPEGRYACEALRAVGVWQDVEPRLVFAENARQVVVWIERGEVDAGIVYETDVARVSGRLVAGPVAPASSHGAILYEGAVLEGARDPGLASHLLEFVTSERGREILDRRGFAPPRPR